MSAFILKTKGTCHMDLAKKFTNNDIYFIEVVTNKIVINDNYIGIIILDDEFGVQKVIDLFDDIVITTSFVKENEIVLYCYENHCFVHLNVETYAYRIIPLDPDLFDTCFLPFYEWTENGLMLLADNGSVFVHLNLLTSTIKKIEMPEIKKLSFSIYDDWRKLSELVVHKVYPNKQTAVIESNNRFEMINYKNGARSALGVKRTDFHDIELLKNLVMQIGEGEVYLSDGVKCVKISTVQEGYRFLRGKFLIIDGRTYILVLTCSNSDSSVCNLEKYSFGTDAIFDKNKGDHPHA